MPPRHEIHARPWIGLAGWIAVTFVAAAAGAFASRNSRDFYLSLARPEWAPPPWVFAPVWTVLYLMMAIAAWLVWRKSGFRAGFVALALFLAQLVLNALWTWLFFEWKIGSWALADIVTLWFLVAATLLAFFWRSKLAAGLLAPYLAWIAFAGFLNHAVWKLNPALLG